MTSHLQAHGAGATTLKNDGAPGSPQTGGPREPQTQSDSGTPRGGCKVFVTRRAELALHGYTLSRSTTDDGPARFCVGRGGMVRELRDLAAVAAFLKQIGGAA